MIIDLYDRKSAPWNSDVVDIIAMESFLDVVWQERPRYPYFGQINDESSTTQKFLKLDNKSVHARNYVGFVQFQDLRINIYPRVFSQKIPFSPSLAIQHLLKWLSYSQRIHFPFAEVALDTAACTDWLEALIFLYASFTADAISTSPYFSYQEVTEEMSFIRGRISMPEYLRHNILTGRQQNIHCTFEPFLYDNLFNRVVKYCTRFLLNFTNSQKNIELLNAILFTLGEVSDISCTAKDCDKIATNRLFPENDVIRNMCRMFLQHHSLEQQNGRENFICLFLPMEIIFEQYVAGFMQQHLRQYAIVSQVKDEFLARTGKDLTEPVFQMRHDILISGKIIIDTKYKFRQTLEDNKNGVSQQDMYQMISYCFKRSIPFGLLLYPSFNEINANNNIATYQVLGTDKTITIQAASIDITENCIDNFEGKQISKFTDLLSKLPTSGQMFKPVSDSPLL